MRRKTPAFRHGDISSSTVGHTGSHARGDYVRPACGQRSANRESPGFNPWGVSTGADCLGTDPDDDGRAASRGFGADGNADTGAEFYRIAKPGAYRANHHCH